MEATSLEIGTSHRDETDWNSLRPQFLADFMRGQQL